MDIKINKFSNRSKNNLKSCHPLLQLLFNRVISHYDCTVVCGHRDEKSQNDCYDRGLSKKRWPEGKHNTSPSMAVDVVPYINGAVSYDKEQCYHFAGYVVAIAGMLGINIRNGADWDGDRDVKDQEFNDLTHFELMDEL